MSARAELVVDLAAIRHNVRLLKELTGTQLMTVVKADGYGHGLAESARAAREGGADWLGVATIDEALALRAAGDTGRVLCWLTVPGDDWGAAIEQDIDVTVYSAAELEEVVATNRPARVQIKVDTGLNRGGCPARGLAGPVRDGVGLPGRRQDPRHRHLVALLLQRRAGRPGQRRPGDGVPATLSNLAAGAGLDEPEVRHLANSAAAILRPSSRLDLVRVGIASYGLDPAPGVTGEIGLRPAMTARASLAMVKHVDAGDAVSYGRTWTADHPTTLGLVPGGYADGLPRVGSNRAEVQVAGKRRRVRGRICMDQLVVDLDGDDPGAGAEVTLFGTGDDGEPTAQDWAEACGTISYEIVTRIGGRFTRRYVDSEVRETIET